MELFVRTRTPTISCKKIQQKKNSRNFSKIYGISFQTISALLKTWVKGCLKKIKKKSNHKLYCLIVCQHNRHRLTNSQQY